MLDEAGTGTDGGHKVPPIEGLMERAQNLSRHLQEAVEAVDGRADSLMNAYRTVLAANEELAEDVRLREAARVEDQQTIARLRAEIERLGQLGNDTLTHLKAAQDERDRVRADLGEALAASRAENEKLRTNHNDLQATHKALIETTARMSSSFDKLLTDVQGRVHGIRDGGRRLSEIVKPTPHRPRPATAATEPGPSMRLVSSNVPPAAPAADDLLDPSDRQAVDSLFQSGFGDIGRGNRAAGA